MNSLSRRAILPAIAALAAALQLVLLWATGIPLGVPGEWTWARNPVDAGWWLELWPAVLCGVLWLGCVAGIAGRIDRWSPAARIGAVWFLGAVGCVWIACVLASIPSLSGLQRAPLVMYYGRTSGYFTQARTQAQDLPRFLANYHELISDESNPANHLHQGTHPPGLTAAFALLIRLADSSPATVNALLATEPRAFHDGVQQIRAVAGQGGPTAADEAVLWLATMIVIALCSFTVVPLFTVMSRSLSPSEAWWGSALWLLVPAACVFIPKSDVMFAGLAMSAQALWLRAIEQRRLLPAVATAVLMFVSVNLSLAFAPLGLILLMQFLLREETRRERASWRPAIVAGLTFLLLILLAWWSCGVNLLPMWRLNLQNHARFYEFFPRTWWKWTPANPLELAGALGLPVVLLAGAGAIRIVRQRTAATQPLLIALAVWGVLWISGKNMGEAARLWIFLMPYAVWAAGLGLHHLTRTQPSRRGVILAILIAQMIVCVGTAARIDGFHFSELVEETRVAVRHSRE